MIIFYNSNQRGCAIADTLFSFFDKDDLLNYDKYTKKIVLLLNC